MYNESSSFSDKIHELQRDHCIQHKTLCCSIKQALSAATNDDDRIQLLSILEKVLVRISTKNNNYMALSLFESSSSFSSSTNNLEQKKFLTFPTFSQNDSNGAKDNRNNDSSSSFFWWFRPSSILNMNSNFKDGETQNPQIEEQKVTMNYVATWLAQYWTLHSSTSQTINHTAVAHNQNNDKDTSARWSSWMYGKTTDLVTSLFAQLDLVDGNTINAKDDQNHFGDDCFDSFDKDQTIQLAEDDCVIASHSMPKPTVTTTALSTPVDKDMILYNIELIISCCQLLSSHVTSETSSSHSHEYEERGQIVDGVLGDGNITFSGFMLYRFMTNKSIVSNFKDSESCLSLAQYANRVGKKHIDQTAGCILQNLPQFSSQLIDLLAQVLIAAKYASWAGEDNSMIVIFSSPQSQTLRNDSTLANEAAVGEGNSYNVAMFQLSNTKHALEGRMEHVLIPKADECKRRAVHEKTVKKNIPLAILYMKRYKVIEDEINRCMNIICNMEQHISSLSMARNNVQIVESYNMLNNAMSTLRVNQEDVEEVMTQIQAQNEQSDVIHNTITCTGSDTSKTIDEEELENELLSLMQEYTNDDKKINDLNAPKETLEHSEKTEKVIDSKEKRIMKSSNLPSISESSTNKSKKEKRQVEVV